MPQKYHVKLSDGREFDVETDGGPPSEQDVLANLDHYTGQTAPPHVSEFQRLQAMGEAKQAEEDAYQRDWPANAASKLPAPLQKPVAIGLSLVRPAAQIAGVLAAAPAALETARNVRQALSEPADAILNAFMRKIGGDPDQLELAATKMRLQAAKSATRQAKMRAGMAEQEAVAARPSTPAEQPLIMTPEQLQAHNQQMVNASLLAKENGMRSAAYGKAAWSEPRQAAPMPASLTPVAEPVAPPAVSGRAAETVREVVKESPAPITETEGAFIMRLAKEGKTPAAIQQALTALRQLSGRAGVMSPEQVAADIAARVGNRSPMR